MKEKFVFLSVFIFEFKVLMLWGCFLYHTILENGICKQQHPCHPQMVHIYRLRPIKSVNITFIVIAKSTCLTKIYKMASTVIITRQIIPCIFMNNCKCQLRYSPLPCRKVYWCVCTQLLTFYTQKVVKLWSVFLSGN